LLLLVNCLLKTFRRRSIKEAMPERGGEGESMVLDLSKQK
jgi:hypothetical protein